MNYRPILFIITSWLCIFGARSPLLGNPLAIDTVRPCFSRVIELQWTGGEGPFSVEHSDSLAQESWNSFFVTADRTAYLDRAGFARFFRIATVNALPAWVREYESFLSTQFKSNRIPGMAIALVEGSNVILAKGYGLRDVEAGLPVNRDTLFHIGSTHKPMTSSLIASLVDDGILNWDTPVSEIWPDFALDGPSATGISIRHLLNMSSGIPDRAEDDLDPDLKDPRELFDFVSKIDPLAGPGQEFSYSNISVSIAGYLGAVASDGNKQALLKGYQALFQERILDPLGMRRATLSAQQFARDDNKSEAYALVDGQAAMTESEDQEEDILAPSGGLKASVSEMASFVIMQIKRGIAPSGKRVLTEANTLECWRPFLVNYGMGWETAVLDDSRLLYHEGAFDNFVSVIAFMPEKKRGYVILINSEDAGSELIEESTARFLQVAGGRP